MFQVLTIGDAGHAGLQLRPPHGDLGDAEREPGVRSNPGEGSIRVGASIVDPHTGGQ